MGVYGYDAFALLRGGYQKVHNVEEDTASRRGVGGDTHLEVTRERNVNPNPNPNASGMGGV